MSDLLERYERLQVLHSIASALNSTLNSHELLELVLKEAVRVTKASSGSIALIDPNTTHLQIEVATGLSKEAQELRMPMDKGITGWVARHGKPLRVGDVSRDPRYVPLRKEVRSELAVPLEFEGLVQGVLNMDSDRLDAFTAADEELLVALAAQSARVLHNAWLIEQLRQKASQLETLITIGHDIISSLTLEEVLQRIVRAARRLMDSRLCSLQLLTPDGEELELKASDGAGDDYIRKPNLRVNESLVGVVVRRRRPLALLDVRESDQYQHTELALKENLVSLLSVPLVYDERAIGVLNAYTSTVHRFSKDETRLLEAIAGLGAVAIQKARLYAKVVDVEEQLRRNEQLSALGLLSAEVAHEIRNPLTVLKMLFHSLNLEFPASDPRTRDAEVIHQKMEDMNRILDRVLMFAKHNEPELRPVDLNALVDDVLLLVRHKLAHQNISLEWQPGPNLPLVSLDRTQIEQAVLNLVLNAAQAMPSGGKLTLRTTIKTNGDQQKRSKKNADASPAPTHVALEVCDTGMGMTSEVRQRLFDPFLTTKATGTGLGLALVHRIVESHDGKIEVDSEVSKGTTMRILLPIVSV